MSTVEERNARLEQDLNQYGLDSLELKALSVPSSLRFLLGIEYDVVLCVNEVGARRPFRLHFPVFASSFRTLLALCATRFGLDCEHSEEESVLNGAASMPLLRYADYLPGALHVKEILECLQVEPATKAMKWKGASASPSHAGSSSSVASTKEAVAVSNSEFEASFIDYSEFSSDSSLEDVHGLGFYLQLDYGLSLATHSHLVGIRFHKDWDATEALREFQEFSGWTEFDLRFQDEQHRQEGGVMVMPSTQDACDLLERYEDEDSDDEGDLLPFILRPVAPLVSVPSLEDAALRKLREQHWKEVEQHWSHFPRTLNTVVVFNLYEGAMLSDVLAFFAQLPIVSSVMVEDGSPAHRRRVFITFATFDATRRALEVDGKNTRGCTVRVQVSPPYISHSRRGTVVKPEREDPPTGGSSSRVDSATAAHPPRYGTAGLASPSSSPPSRAHDSHNHGGAAAVPAKVKTSTNSSGIRPTTASTASVGKLDVSKTKPAAAGAPAPDATAFPGPEPPSVTALSSSMPHASAISTAAAIAGAIAARAHAAAASSLTPATVAATAVGPGGPGSLDKATRTSVTSSPGGTLMNASAKEFVPHFQLNANSPEYTPSPSPSTDMVCLSLPARLDATGLPPPPPSLPPPPPSYVDAVSPGLVYRSTPLSARLAQSSVSLSLPSYSLPPPYVSTAEGRGGEPFPLPPPPPPYRGD